MSMIRLMPFEIGDQRVALDLADVNRIDRVDRLRVRSKPGARLRIGQLDDDAETPVYSLAVQLGDRPSRPAPSNRILVIDGPDGRPLGWLVDRVVSALQTTADRIRPLPSLLGKRAIGPYRGMAMVDGERAVLVLSRSALTSPGIDTDQLVESPVSSSARTTGDDLPVAPRRDGRAGRLLLFDCTPRGPHPTTTFMGLSIRQVVEVLDAPETVVLPRSPQHVRGLAVWREQPLVVLDLQHYLGWPAPPRRAASRLIVVRLTSDEVVGLPASDDLRGCSLPLPHRAIDDPTGAYPQRLRGAFAIEGGVMLVPRLHDLVSDSGSARP